jgi:hypothetical protein
MTQRGELRNLGSNQNQRIQSAPCFLYTIPQINGTLSHAGEK